MRLMLALIAVALLFAGCTSPPAPTAIDPTNDPEPVCVALVDERLHPVLTWTLEIPALNLNLSSDAGGKICIPAIETQDILLVTVRAPEREPVTTQWLPGTPLRLAIGPAAVALEPYVQQQEFTGFIACAHELLIISGSCDAAANATNDAVDAQAGARPLPEPLEKSNKFDFTVERSWATMVVDITFDAQAHPGIAGIRSVLRGSGDAQALNQYEQYGRWYNSSSYTFHVTPGQNYTDADAIVSGNSTTFQLEFLPHSYAYHSLCSPDGETCFLGGAATTDLEFEAIVTMFYIAPAPSDWSARDS